jgi:hypothetical protein
MILLFFVLPFIPPVHTFTLICHYVLKHYQKLLKESVLTDLFTWIAVVVVVVVVAAAAAVVVAAAAAVVAAAAEVVVGEAAALVAAVVVVAVVMVVEVVIVVVVVLVCILACVGMRACTRVRGRGHACSLDMCHTIIHASSYRNSLVD